MSDRIPCPDCGRLNAAGAASCANCNFPLRPGGEDPAPRVEPTARASEPAEAREPATRPPRPARIRRPRPQQQSLSIWLLVAAVAAATAVIIGVRGYKQTNVTPIEGAKVDQQKRADQFRTALAQDSTDTQAHVGLGDVLFDTGNWSDAIIEYRAALARDSSRASTLVDLGVCYYNLSDTQQAEKLFQLALVRDPRQPIALFNLGIVNERRGDNKEALRYLHLAMENGAPESMNQALVEAMQRVQKAVGAQAPPLAPGQKR